MSTKNVIGRISNIHYTTEEWESHSSAVLNSGEIGLEYTSENSFKMKVGDGVNTWSNLPYYAVAREIEVQDDLTSTSTDIALSANQGRVLKSLIDELTSKATEIETALGYVYGYGNGFVKTVTGLTITGDWTNTQYVNTTVDYTGLIFTASYSDGSTATVTPTSLSPSTWGATVGSQTCVFTYTENGVSVTASKSANVQQQTVTVDYLTFTPSTGTVSVTPGYVPEEATSVGRDSTWNATTKEYSIDGGNTWLPYTKGTTVTGNTIKFRGLGGTKAGGWSDSSSSRYSWVVTGTDVNVSGNIETLLDYQTVANGNHPTMEQYCYYSMFYGNTAIISASDIFPDTTLIPNCYTAMFTNCTSLTTTPALPCTTLATQCYSRLFEGCTSLTTAPELPATTLESGCYIQMFKNCTSLTTVPELPATTLAEYCYSSMFSGCTSLYVSDTSGTGYDEVWLIPTEGPFTNTYAQASMFRNCLGTRSSDSMAGQAGQSYTYYTQNYPVPHPVEKLKVGGRIFYIHDDNGATYTFYDQQGNVLPNQTVEGLANAYEYEISGTPTSDKFYVYDSTNGVATGKMWGKRGTVIIGTAYKEIGDGKINTATALAYGNWGINTIFYYVQSVNENQIGGCNDWFIGSRDELLQLRSSGLVDWFNSSYIWTSTEGNKERARACKNNEDVYLEKNTNYYVIPFRAF